MVIQVIDIDGIPLFETKNEAPVTAHCDRPNTRQITLQTMQSPTRSAHIFRPRGVIQCRKENPQLQSMPGVYPTFGTGPEKRLEPFVPESAYHAQTVKCLVTLVNGKIGIDYGDCRLVFSPYIAGIPADRERNGQALRVDPASPRNLPVG